MKNSLSVYLNNTDVLSSDFHTAKDRSLFLCQVLREIQLCEDLTALIDLNSTYGNGKVQASRFLTVFHRLSEKLEDKDKITTLAVCSILLSIDNGALGKVHSLDLSEEQKKSLLQEILWRFKLLFSNGSTAANVKIEKEYSTKHPLVLAVGDFATNQIKNHGVWVVQATLDYMSKIALENDPNCLSEERQDEIRSAFRSVSGKFSMDVYCPTYLQ